MGTCFHNNRYMQLIQMLQLRIKFGVAISKSIFSTFRARPYLNLGFYPNKEKKINLICFKVEREKEREKDRHAERDCLDQ